MDWMSRVGFRGEAEIFLFATPSRLAFTSVHITFYSASHSRVAPENVDLQKEQKYNTFACHTCNEMRLSQVVLEMPSLSVNTQLNTTLHVSEGGCQNLWCHHLDLTLDVLT
jgi:hypothetical protein